MKKFIALSALAVSSLTFAANNSAINDLQYLPDAGTAFGTTDFNSIKYSNRFFDGTIIAKNEVKGFQVAQTFGYALMNNFSLAVGLSYQDTETKTTGERTTNTTGLGDIEILGRYRLIDTGNRLDLLGKISVSPGDAEVDKDGDENGYTGGHAVALGAEYGAKKASHQWSVSGLYTRNLKATTEDKSGGAKTKFKDDAHGQLTFQANLLTQLSESSYIKTFAAVDFTEEYDDNQDNTVTGSTMYTLSGEYQYVMTKDVYLHAGAASIIGGNGYNTVVMVYNLGANYQF